MTKTWLNGIFGIAAVLTVPLVIGALYYTQLVILLAIILLAGVILMLPLAAPLSGIIVGFVLAELITGKKQVSIIWTIIGSVTLATVWFIPYFGPPIVTVTILVIVGSLAKFAYRHLNK